MYELKFRKQTFMMILGKDFSQYVKMDKKSNVVTVN
jgi:hypothetical protein